MGRKKLHGKSVTVKFSKEFADENKNSEIIGDVELIVETRYGEDEDDKINFKHNDEDETYIFVEDEYGDDKKIVV